MATMNRIQRVLSVVDGEAPDRPPVSFWCHFAPGAECGQPAIDAHLNHLARFDLDFLKVMNDNGYPTRREVRSAANLRHLPVLQGDEEAFGRQLDLIRTLCSRLLGEMLLVTTVFNAWTVLRRLVVPRTTDRHNPPTLGGALTPIDARVSELLAEDRGAVASALDTIAASLANFARRCIEAGADGIFLSVRDDWVNTQANGLDTYRELVRRGDAEILTAAGEGRFNCLHVCGVPQDFDSFANYPIHAINWADRAAGPSIAEVIDRIKPAVCGGVDNLSTLPDGSPAAVASEVDDALRQAGGRPIMLSGGCTYDPDLVPASNLAAIVHAARSSQTR